LRPAGEEYDSRRHGFRAILDLLHQAQREGGLRLHRDRKGTWRVFPAAPATPARPALSAVPVAEATESEPAPAEVDVAWEDRAPDIEEVTEEATKVEETPLAELAAPVVSAEPAPEPAPPARKVRKSRAARGAKGGPRRVSSRRKPKEPAASDQ
jgi:hypothetical protein